LLFPSLFFGQLLHYGITAYKSGQYTEADDLFDKVLAINQTDFEAIFWKMRATAMKNVSFASGQQGCPAALRRGLDAVGEEKSVTAS